MGIYISGVKGLPEQVQKNKEDIKNIQDEIEGIDFDTIRELEEQVGENTQDINNLEASIGVQNQAINTLNDNLDNEVAERKALIDLTEGDADIKKENVRIATIKSKSNVFDLNVLGNSEDEAEFNINLINDGVQAHNLFFSTNGDLLIDGQTIGDGSALYNHKIQIKGYLYSCNIYLVLSTSQPLTTDDLISILTSNGFTSQSNLYNINIIASINFTTPTYVSIRGIYAQSNTLYIRAHDSASGNLTNYNSSVEYDDIIPVNQI